MSARRRRPQRRGRVLARALGLGGVLCMAVSLAGLVLRPAGPPPQQRFFAASPAPQKAGAGASYYPLEVGRYWRYVGAQPGDTEASEVERRIVRCEQRPDGEVYHFADGALAFQREGRTYEVGAEGGVNVVPLGTGLEERPYIYTSRGFRVEQEIGARDTLLVLESRPYPGCVQVITHFQQPGEPESRSYASYYARGIGLVGREPWPPEGTGQLVVRLREHGRQSL
ncbi:MAG: hypothetical protein AB1505_04310 [Candidatus Latescibacterota bacterium]